MASSLLTGIDIATMAEGGAPYGMIRDGAILLDGATMRWVGDRADAPAGDQVEDLGGRLVTPAPIDCHTHLVFGGDRAVEFEMRLKGASYQEIARAGGGILSTVLATRAAGFARLVDDALARVDTLLGEGVATIEIKSGYGLDQETELQMLRVARHIGTVRPVHIITSFLGAHSVPADFNGSGDDYIDNVCIPTLRAAHAEGLVDAVDGFCEGIAFSTDQIARVFEVAKSLGLPVKLHAEQLSNIGGTQLAARFGALSVDHIEYANRADISAMADAGSVGVLLPGAFYTLRETQAPPVQDMRDLGVAMALASDCNPGSSPLGSILLTMNMGCTLFGLTPEEALSGVTRNAARALGLTDTGVIAPGKVADLAVWNINHPAELSYRIGENRLFKRIYKGSL